MLKQLIHGVNFNFEVLVVAILNSVNQKSLSTLLFLIHLSKLLVYGGCTSGAVALLFSFYSSSTNKKHPKTF